MTYKLPDLPPAPFARGCEPSWWLVLDAEAELTAVPEVRRAVDEMQEYVARLRAALAGHLFDGESASTRECLRHELVDQGLAALARERARDGAEDGIPGSKPVI